jgi:formylglycine-generating enzyme required for sulfatase activity
MSPTNLLVKRLAAHLEPLFRTVRERQYWLTLAGDEPLLASIDREGTPAQFSRHLAHTLLVRQGAAGRQALCDLIDEVVAQERVEAEVLGPLRSQINAYDPAPVDYRDDAEPLPPPAALADLRSVVCNDGPPLALSPKTLTEVLRYSPPDLAGYRLGRIADWCQPRYALDKRFVRLTLLLDKGEDAAGPRWEQSRRFGDLQRVLEEVDAPALVLLGAPGSGKSTLLRRLELDLALAAVRSDDSEASLSLFVPLNQYRRERPGDPPPPPEAWLEALWGRRFPDLPDLDALLRRGRLVLLLDGLNEMPHGSVADYRDLVAQWSGFLGRLTRERPGNRVLFSCRSLDYSVALSTTDLPVPLLRIEALEDEQVRAFLEAYSEHAEAIWQGLRGRQLDLYRSPYYLNLLVGQVGADGHLPEGRAGLFTGFVRAALQREIERRHNSLLQPGRLLDERDCQKLVGGHWRDPFDLPRKGPLIPGLGRLAYGMQASREGGEAAQVRIEEERALALLGDEEGEELLHAGVDLGVLERDLGREEVYYVHQLLQEYFAARELAARPDPVLARTPWRAREMRPSLADELARIGDADPLPPAPATGWEETMLLTAAMTENAEALVTELMEANLPLAGRCAAQPEVRLVGTVKERLARALIARSREPAADLRARIAAARALGELGDPRFERGGDADSSYLLPPLVTIPAGTYPIGSDEGRYDDEAPAHEVTLEAFALGRFPVTNAEWALFMADGGYEDETWWEGETARAWRKGEGTAEGPRQQWREDRKYLQENFAGIRKAVTAGRITSKQADDWEQIARMGDEEFEDWLAKQFPEGRQAHPRYWQDEAFNHLSQPVVGICLHEARAYCAWLSARSGLAFRLPTEVEWEAAARGSKGRRYAYGKDYDSALCNTFETHVRGTTPVGVFPGGETPEGLVDMTGNVWEWTSTLYKPYPYDPTDGREDALDAEGRRVVRGGSWDDDQDYARAAYRAHYDPGLRDFNLGCRVLCASPIS